MVDTIEVAAKSQHILNLRAEIDKLESDKARINDWIKGKEKEMDSINAQATKVREELSKEKKESENRLNEIKKAQFSIDSQRAVVNDLNRSLENKRVKLENLEARLIEYQRELNAQSEELNEKKAALDKKESCVNSFFEGLEKLRKP